MSAVESAMDMAMVSVIIPTCNREHCLTDLIKALLEQDYKNYEIIVIDQSDRLSQEKLLLIREHRQKLRHFRVSEKGRSQAKNYGILQARGEVLLFCDDDILPPANFISAHAKNYLDNSIGAVSCRLIEEGQKATPIKRVLETTFYGRLINRPYSTVSTYATSLNGGNMSIRRSAIEKCGFFEEYFQGTSMVEEPDFAYRILNNGYQIFFDASITVVHCPQGSGNLAIMNARRADWFHYYFHNLVIFFVKYGRFANLPFVFAYCILVSLKHVVLHRLNAKQYFYMMGGFFSGLRKGLKLFHVQRQRIFYTNYRYPKQNIEETN